MRNLQKVNPDAAEDFNAAFEKFRKKAIKYKKAIKSAKKEADENASISEEEKAKAKYEKLLSEFKNWLPSQEIVADRLAEELAQKKHDL